MTDASQRARPPVVLQVLPDIDGGGGVERGTIDMTRALAQAGYGAIVVSNGTRLALRIEAVGGKHIRLPVHSKNPFVMAANIGRLARLIESMNVDIVHVRSRAPAWSAYYAARRTRRHFITTVHGTYGTRLSYKRLYNAIMTRGERVIAISEFIADHIVKTYGADPSRIRVIPRGIDPVHFDPATVRAERVVNLARRWQLDDGVPVVMMPGRLTSSWKGHAVLIAAMARLGRHDVYCLMVGDIEGGEANRARLLKWVSALGLVGRVRFVGRCDDMPAAYRLADVVVSASTRPEAFGRVAVEAQAMGVPLIATALGATQETVQHGVTGWLVPPNDSVALAAAIGQALALEHEARLALAAAARAHVAANFSQEQMCARTLALYAEVLAEAPRFG
jgi:glycosyltransferase involved in cell wall biosynthesis